MKNKNIEKYAPIHAFTALDLIASLKAVLDHNARLDPHHQDLCKVCGPARALLDKMEDK